MAEAPTFIEPVVGYRTWGLEHGWILASQYARTVWRPGVNIATCEFGQGTRGLLGGLTTARRRMHAVPAEDCECGFYALHDIAEISGWRYEPPCIVGAVIGWGRVRVHASGWRAERASIVAIAWHERWPLQQRLLAYRAACLYGVPYVHIGRLEQVARGRGAPVAESVRPPQPEAPAPGVRIVVPVGGDREVVLTLEQAAWRFWKTDPLGRNWVASRAVTGVPLEAVSGWEALCTYLRNLVKGGLPADYWLTGLLVPTPTTPTRPDKRPRGLDDGRVAASSPQPSLNHHYPPWMAAVARRAQRREVFWQGFKRGMEAYGRVLAWPLPEMLRRLRGRAPP